MFLGCETRNSFMRCIIYNSWTTRRRTRKWKTRPIQKLLSRWTNESWSSSQCLPKALRDSVFFFISPHCQYFSGAYSKTRTISCSQIRKYLHDFVAEWGHSHPFVLKLICIMLSHTTRLSQKQEHILLCKSQRCSASQYPQIRLPFKGQAFSFQVKITLKCFCPNQDELTHTSVMHVQCYIKHTFCSFCPVRRGTVLCSV